MTVNPPDATTINSWATSITLILTTIGSLGALAVSIYIKLAQSAHNAKSEAGAVVISQQVAAIHAAAPPIAPLEPTPVGAPIAQGPLPPKP